MQIQSIKVGYDHAGVGRSPSLLVLVSSQKNVSLDPGTYRKYYANKKLKIREMSLQAKKAQPENLEKL